MFYEFKQNNSGGYFEVNNNVCNRLIIESNNEFEAVEKAEILGVYFDGVENQRDCSCCGDRWYQPELIEMDEIKENGYWLTTKDKKRWKEKYSKYTVHTEAYEITEGFMNGWFGGGILLKNIEEYAQFMANEYGWTTPDIRIFYKNGEIKEVFTQK